ncbi:hypothetical protein [Terrabacter sp. MAHUQ-38]|uniref:hypothetical protein n=1 Tax=unclassified Terrabacter TaxID=2630222 RepID=UPI00165DADF7|nr:hypothetical protein [Terrabacter sp. MAHUQ-38]MBC9821877.1 hypothetical protein [Terrabacter sp. MAHUQ-38]
MASETRARPPDEVDASGASGTAERPTPWAARRSLRGLPVVVTVLAAWVVTLPRLVPSTFGDHGTYISVAERLLAGDRLYVDVWDNKDPLFYYVLAAGRLVSPLSDIVVEVLWVLVAGASVVVLGRTAGAARGLALVAGLGATPLLLTGPAYETGMTHLPGIAFVLAALACAVRSRWILAGALVGLLLFTKLIIAPVAAGALLVVALHRRSVGGIPGILRATIAGVMALGAGVTALWLRGELPGWLGNFKLNADYADGELAQSQYGSTVGHLLRAFPEDGRGAGTITIATIVAVLLVVRRSRTEAPTSTDPALRDDGRTRGDDGRTPARTISPAVLWDLTLVSLGLAVVVIAVTATWPHHAQSLSVPGACALALVATRLSRPAAGWQPAAVLLVAGYVVAGALHPYFYLTAARSVSSSVQQLQRDSPASEIIDQHPQVRTYARAGSNDVDAHAVGLRDVELVCPRFHQYSLESAAILELTAACLPRADAIIVDDTVRPEADEPEWNAYVARVRALVSTGYDCVRATGTEVCFRRTA